MIRILHLSDSHFSERLRLPDIIEIHRVMLERARELRVNLILHGGDFFHAKSTPAERTALAEWLQAAAEIAPVFGSKGNHDSAGDLSIFNRLETKHPVIIEERVTAEPGSARILTLEDGARVGLLGMSWIDKAQLAAGLDATVDQQASSDMTIAAMRDLLVCLRAEAQRVKSEGAVPLLTTHVMIGGSVMSSGQVLIGHGVEMSPADLIDTGVAYVACGHVHVAQDFADGRVAYSGSPVRHNLGEPEAKGFRLVTLENDGAFLASEFIELPARRIVLIESNQLLSPEVLIDEAFQAGVRGALVRFRYRATPEMLASIDEDALRRSLLGMGAHEVKLEAVIVQEQRVRSEAIVTAQSNWDRVMAYLTAKAIDVDEATRARIRGKLDSIEARSREAVAA